MRLIGKEGAYVLLSAINPGIPPMPKPNYAFAKRQREMAKKQKKEAKQRERAAERIPAADPTPSDAPDTPAAPQAETPGG